jgi:Tc5 transposase DNA-binding domain
MDHNARLESAIIDLESQSRVNYAAAAKKWKVERTTLAKRHKGQTGTREDATSDTHRKLTNAQEEVLIQYINKLSDRGLPPTPQIVKNIAEEIAYVKLSPNWVSRFCKRHRDQLKSVYLRMINHKRKIADNSYHFQYFYDTVRMLFICVTPAFRLHFACKPD